MPGPAQDPDAPPDEQTTGREPFSRVDTGPRSPAPTAPAILKAIPLGGAIPYADSGSSHCSPGPVLQDQAKMDGLSLSFDDPSLWSFIPGPSLSDTFGNSDPTTLNFDSSSQWNFVPIPSSLNTFSNSYSPTFNFDSLPQWSSAPFASSSDTLGNSDPSPFNFDSSSQKNFVPFTSPSNNAEGENLDALPTGDITSNPPCLRSSSSTPVGLAPYSPHWSHKI